MISTFSPLIYHWTHFHQITTLDLNALTGESNAFPQLVNDSHGTNCAGIIAMEKSNRVCGVGVAYQSSITGNFFMLVYIVSFVRELKMSM